MIQVSCEKFVKIALALAFATTLFFIPESTFATPAISYDGVTYPGDDEDHGGTKINDTNTDVTSFTLGEDTVNGINNNILMTGGKLQLYNGYKVNGTINSDVSGENELQFEQSFGLNGNIGSTNSFQTIGIQGFSTVNFNGYNVSATGIYVGGATLITGGGTITGNIDISSEQGSNGLLRISEGTIINGNIKGGGNGLGDVSVLENETYHGADGAYLEADIFRLQGNMGASGSALNAIYIGENKMLSGETHDIYATLIKLNQGSTFSTGSGTIRGLIVGNDNGKGTLNVDSSFVTSSNIGSGGGGGYLNTIHVGGQGKLTINNNLNANNINSEGIIDFSANSHAINANFNGGVSSTTNANSGHHTINGTLILDSQAVFASKLSNSGSGTDIGSITSTGIASVGQGNGAGEGNKLSLDISGLTLSRIVAGTSTYDLIMGAENSTIFQIQDADISIGGAYGSNVLGNLIFHTAVSGDKLVVNFTTNTSIFEVANEAVVSLGSENDIDEAAVIVGVDATLNLDSSKIIGANTILNSGAILNTGVGSEINGFITGSAEGVGTLNINGGSGQNGQFESNGNIGYGFSLAAVNLGNNKALRLDNHNNSLNATNLTLGTQTILIAGSGDINTTNITLGAASILVATGGAINGVIDGVENFGYGAGTLKIDDNKDFVFNSNIGNTHKLREINIMGSASNPHTFNINNLIIKSDIFKIGSNAIVNFNGATVINGVIEDSAEGESAFQTLSIANSAITADTITLGNSSIINIGANSNINANIIQHYGELGDFLSGGGSGVINISENFTSNGNFESSGGGINLLNGADLNLSTNGNSINRYEIDLSANSVLTVGSGAISDSNINGHTSGVGGIVVAGGYAAENIGNTNSLELITVNSGALMDISPNFRLNATNIAVNGTMNQNDLDSASQYSIGANIAIGETGTFNSGVFASETTGTFTTVSGSTLRFTLSDDVSSPGDTSGSIDSSLSAIADGTKLYLNISPLTLGNIEAGTTTYTLVLGGSDGSINAISDANINIGNGYGSNVAGGLRFFTQVVDNSLVLKFESFVSHLDIYASTDPLPDPDSNINGYGEVHLLDEGAILSMGSGDIDANVRLVAGSTLETATGDVNGTINGFNGAEQGTLNITENFSTNGNIGSTFSLAQVNIADGKTLTIFSSNELKATAIKLGEFSELTAGTGQIIGAIDGADDGFGTLTIAENFSTNQSNIGSSHYLSAINISDGKTLTVTSNIAADTVNIGAGILNMGAGAAIDAEVRLGASGVLNINDAGFVTHKNITNVVEGAATINIFGESSLDLAANDNQLIAEGASIININLDIAATLTLGSGSSVGTINALNENGYGNLNFTKDFTVNKAIGDNYYLGQINLASAHTEETAYTVTINNDINADNDLRATSLSIGNYSTLVANQSTIATLGNISIGGHSTLTINEGSSLSVAEGYINFSADYGTMNVIGSSIESNINLDSNHGTLNVGAGSDIFGAITMGEGSRLNFTGDFTSSNDISGAFGTVVIGANHTLDIDDNDLDVLAITLNNASVLKIGNGALGGTIDGYADGHGRLDVNGGVLVASNIGNTHRLNNVILREGRTLNVADSNVTLKANTITLEGDSTLIVGSGALAGAINGDSTGNGTLEFNHSVPSWGVGFLSTDVAVGSNNILNTIKIADNTRLETYADLKASNIDIIGNLVIFGGTLGSGDAETSTSVITLRGGEVGTILDNAQYDGRLDLFEGGSIHGSIQAATDGVGRLKLYTNYYNYLGIGSETVKLDRLDIGTGSTLYSNSDIGANKIYIAGELEFNSGTITGSIQGAGGSSNSGYFEINNNFSTTSAIGSDYALRRIYVEENNTLTVNHNISSDIIDVAGTMNFTNTDRTITGGVYGDTYDQFSHPTFDLGLGHHTITGEFATDSSSDPKREKNVIAIALNGSSSTTMVSLTSAGEMNIDGSTKLKLNISGITASQSLTYKLLAGGEGSAINGFSAANISVNEGYNRFGLFKLSTTVTNDILTLNFTELTSAALNVGATEHDALVAPIDYSGTANDINHTNVHLVESGAYVTMGSGTINGNVTLVAGSTLTAGTGSIFGTIMGRNSEGDADASNVGTLNFTDNFTSHGDIGSSDAYLANVNLVDTTSNNAYIITLNNNLNTQNLVIGDYARLNVYSNAYTEASLTVHDTNIVLNNHSKLYFDESTLTAVNLSFEGSDAILDISDSTLNFSGENGIVMGYNGTLNIRDNSHINGNIIAANGTINIYDDFTTNGNISGNSAVVIHESDELNLFAHNNSLSAASITLHEGATLNIGSGAVSGLINGDAAGHGRVNFNRDFIAYQDIGGTNSLAEVNVYYSNAEEESNTVLDLKTSNKSLSANTILLGGSSELIVGSGAVNGNIVGASYSSNDGTLGRGTLTLLDNFTTQGTIGNGDGNDRVVDEVITGIVDNIQHLALVKFGVVDAQNNLTFNINHNLKSRSIEINDYTETTVSAATMLSDTNINMKSNTTLSLTSSAILTAEAINANSESGSSTINVTGSTVNGAILLANNGVLNVNAGSVINGSIDIGGTSSVNFNANFQTNGNITNSSVDNSSSVSLLNGADLDLSANNNSLAAYSITLSQNSELKVGSGTVAGEIDGDDAGNGSIRFMTGSTFNGRIGSTKAINSVALHDASAEGSYTVNLNGNLKVNNSLVIGDYATLAIVGSTINSGLTDNHLGDHATLTLTAGSTFNERSESALYTTDHGTINLSETTLNGNIVLDNNGALNVSGGSTINGNVDVKNSSSINFSSTTTTNGNITNSAGTSTISLLEDATLNFSNGNSLAATSLIFGEDSILHSGTGDITAAISLGGGAVFYAGSGNVIGAIDGSEGGLGNLNISSSNLTTRGNIGAINYLNSISIGSGRTLDIATNNNSLAATTTNLNGSLSAGSANISSNIFMGSGSFLNTGTGAINGDIKSNDVGHAYGTVNVNHSLTTNGNFGEYDYALAAVNIAAGATLDLSSEDDDLVATTIKLDDGATLTLGSGDLIGDIRGNSAAVGTVNFTETFATSANIGIDGLALGTVNIGEGAALTANGNINAGNIVVNGTLNTNHDISGGNLYVYGRLNLGDVSRDIGVSNTIAFENSTVNAGSAAHTFGSFATTSGGILGFKVTETVAGSINSEIATIVSGTKLNLDISTFDFDNINLATTYNLVLGNGESSINAVSDVNIDLGDESNIFAGYRFFTTVLANNLVLTLEVDPDAFIVPHDQHYDYSQLETSIEQTSIIVEHDGILSMGSGNITGNTTLYADAILNTGTGTIDGTINGSDYGNGTLNVVNDFNAMGNIGFTRSLNEVNVTAEKTFNLGDYQLVASNININGTLIVGGDSQTGSVSAVGEGSRATVNLGETGSFEIGYVADNSITASVNGSSAGFGDVRISEDVTLSHLLIGNTNRIANLIIEDGSEVSLGSDVTATNVTIEDSELRMLDGTATTVTNRLFVDGESNSTYFHLGQTDGEGATVVGKVEIQGSDGAEVNVNTNSTITGDVEFIGDGDLNLYGNSTITGGISDQSDSDSYVNIRGNDVSVTENISDIYNFTVDSVYSNGNEVYDEDGVVGSIFNAGSINISTRNRISVEDNASLITSGNLATGSLSLRGSSALETTGTITANSITLYENAALTTSGIISRGLNEDEEYTNSNIRLGNNATITLNSGSQLYATINDETENEGGIGHGSIIFADRLSEENTSINGDIGNNYKIASISIGENVNLDSNGNSIYTDELTLAFNSNLTGRDNLYSSNVGVDTNNSEKGIVASPFEAALNMNTLAISELALTSGIITSFSETTTLRVNAANNSSTTIAVGQDSLRTNLGRDDAESILSNTGTGNAILANNAENITLTINNKVTGTISAAGDESTAIRLREDGGDSTLTLTNAGLIHSNYRAINSDFNSTITNNAGGTIEGEIYLRSSGASSITNRGTITGNIDIFSSGEDSGISIINGGSVNGNIYLGNSSHLVNFNGGTLNGNIGTETDNNDRDAQGAVLVSANGAATFSQATTYLNVETFTTQENSILNLTFTGTTATALEISGAASIASSTTLNLTISGSIDAGQHYTVLKAANLTGGPMANSYVRINGSSNSYDGKTFSAVFIDNELRLIASSQAAPAIKTQLSGVKDAFNGIVTINNPDGNLLAIQNLLNDSNTSNATREEIVKSVLPQVDNGTNRNSFNIANSSVNVATGRVDTLRNGIASGDAPTVKRVWMESFGNYTSQKSTSTSNGYNLTSHGFAIGGDKEIADDEYFGANLSYANSGIKSRGASKSTQVTTYQANLYATKNFRNLFLDTVAGVALNKYESHRSISAIGASASADYLGKAYISKVRAGSVINLKNSFILAPELSVTAARNNVDSYTESGAGNLNLHVKTSSANFLEGRFGLNLSHKSRLNDKTIIPQIRLSYGYDFAGSRQSSNSNFVGQSTNFQSQGDKIVRGSVRIGTGIKVYSKENVIVSADYDLELKDGYRSDTGTARLTYGF